MKHLKAKLMASVGMLLVAIIMMSTASYAWFTISTAPEIANVSANVTTNGNFEIALDNGEWTTPGASAVGDSGKNQTWGNLVDLKSAFVDDSGANKVTLKPVQVTVANNAFVVKAPVYGKDGRAVTLAQLNPTSMTDVTGQFGDISGVVKYASGSDIYAVGVRFWLRSNTTTDISLSTAATRASTTDVTPDWEDGLGSFIHNDAKKNVTILFIDHDNGTTYLASRTDAEGNLALVSTTLTAEGVIPEDGAAANIRLTANTAKAFEMLIFMNGVGLTNADAEFVINAVTMNIQFKSSVSLDAMPVSHNGQNGRK